jgi:hypothetical protein
MPSRSRVLSLVLVVLAVAVLATTGGAATRKGALVKVSKTSLGRILVDSRGRTLYRPPFYAVSPAGAAVVK